MQLGEAVHLIAFIIFPPQSARALLLPDISLFVTAGDISVVLSLGSRDFYEHNSPYNQNAILLWGAWLAWLVKHAILNPGVVRSSATLGAEITLKKGNFIFPFHEFFKLH